MIKYRPVRNSLSDSIKEEQTFCSIEDLKQYLFVKWDKILRYAGTEHPICFDDITVSEVLGDEKQTGYTNIRNVYLNHCKQFCIGICGE